VNKRQRLKTNVSKTDSVGHPHQHLSALTAQILRPMLPFNEQEWLHHLDSELSQIEAHHERTLHLITRYQPIN